MLFIMLRVLNENSFKVIKNAFKKLKIFKNKTFVG